MEFLFWTHKLILNDPISFSVLNPSEAAEASGLGAINQGEQ